MFYMSRSLFLMTALSVLFAGDEKALREDILNDPAFQRVWTFLENKDIPKDYVINTFLDSGIQIHSKIITSFNNPF